LRGVSRSTTAVVADASKLSVYSTSPATAAGDNNVRIFCFATDVAAFDYCLDRARFGRASLSRGQYRATCQKFHQQQGNARRSRRNCQPGAESRRFDAAAEIQFDLGVNIDTEMASLIPVQNTTRANAHIMKVVQSMMTSRAGTRVRRSTVDQTSINYGASPARPVRGNINNQLSHLSTQSPGLKSTNSPACGSMRVRGRGAVASLRTSPPLAIPSPTSTHHFSGQPALHRCRTTAGRAEGRAGTRRTDRQRADYRPAERSVRTVHRSSAFETSRRSYIFSGQRHQYGGGRLRRRKS